jgi:queuine tRNA-ribosyltransferase
MAFIAEPDKRWRVDLTAARFKSSREPIEDGCPCPACVAGYSRGYLRYLAKNRELTGLRLLTLHNLTFTARVMRDLRDAITEGRLPEVAAAIRAGEPPSQEPVALLNGQKVQSADSQN